MGNVSMGPSPSLTLALRDLFKIRCFLETGTLHGTTTLWAGEHFAKVITIEASRHYYETAQASFADHLNISSFHGDAGKTIASLISDLPPTLFFLDAHWSGGVTAGEESECPLLTELGLIMPWFRKHVVLIDDARLFLQPPTRPHRLEEWPSLDDISRVTQGLAYIAYYEDLLILAPSVHRLAVAEVIRSLY